MEYTNTGLMKTYLKNTLSKLEMDDPIELNNQVIKEAELRKKLEEEAAMAENPDNDFLNMQKDVNKAGSDASPEGSPRKSLWINSISSHNHLLSL